MKRQLAVLDGWTYADRRQVLNRMLGPAYLLAFRWLGSADDSESVAFSALAMAVQDLSWPASVGVVNDHIERAVLAELDLHWFESYQVGATAAAIEACEGRGGGVAPSFEDLVAGLCTRERLLLVLHFARRRPLGSIAAQLGESREQAVSGVLDSLVRVATGLGLEADGPRDAERLIPFFDSLIGRRRPARFAAGRCDWAVMAAASHLQSAIAGNNLMRRAFRQAVYESRTLAS